MTTTPRPVCAHCPPPFVLGWVQRPLRRTWTWLTSAGVLGLLGACGHTPPTAVEPPSASGVVLPAATTAASGTVEQMPTVATSASPAVEPNDPIRTATDRASFARAVVQRHGLDAHWVQQTLAQAQTLPRIAQLMQPAPRATSKNWRAYRARFVEPTRVAAGVKFWQRHRATLERAQAQYGVPAHVVVGIIGVETLYGQHTGNFRVLDALVTLAFDFPASHPRAAERSAYFRGELEQFLLLSQRSGTDPTSWRGSYAGAIGLPQFMPSSWAKLAVDFDGDGRIDLRGSPADAIGSVAHYLQAFGWQRGQPTHYPVEQLPTHAQALNTLLAPDILPTFSAQRLQALGVGLPTAAQQHRGPLALVELHNGDPTQGGGAPSYVLGTDNFYAVTRYNWSSYYALAVLELGQAVQAQWLRQNAP
ncbi:MAG: lytic murein transglycosylase B [Macromonas sp.]